MPIKKIKTILLTIAMMAIPLVLSPSTTVSAATCVGKESRVLECAGDGEQAMYDILRIVIVVLTAGIGILAVGAVTFGAILYSSAGGNPENIKKAKTLWLNTVIGLALFAFMAAILNFIIPGGIL